MKSMSDGDQVLDDSFFFMEDVGAYNLRMKAEAEKARAKPPPRKQRTAKLPLRGED